MANVKQYLMNKLSSMLISIIQGSKLLSTIIGDMGVLGRQIKIEARHQILHQMNLPTLCLCRMHRLNSNRVWSSQLKQTIAGFDEKLATILIKQTPHAVKRRPARRRRDGEVGMKDKAAADARRSPNLSSRSRSTAANSASAVLASYCTRSGNPRLHSAP